MARISTHVLDIARGRPAAGIAVSLTSAGHPGAFATTNADGRTDAPLVSEPELQSGAWELRFNVGDYFRANGDEAFFEQITISFVVRDGSANHHVPLLLAPHAYSTYRGS